MEGREFKRAVIGASIGIPLLIVVVDKLQRK